MTKSFLLRFLHRISLSEIFRTTEMQDDFSLQLRPIFKARWFGVELGRLIALHPRLVRLNLGNNRLSPSLVFRIALGLRRNTSLQFLSLSGSTVSPAAINALAEALRRNSTLGSLDLSCILLNRPGVSLDPLFHALQFNHSLRVLNITSVKLTARNLDQIQHLRTIHPHLRILIFDELSDEEDSDRESDQDLAFTSSTESSEDDDDSDDPNNHNSNHHPVAASSSLSPHDSPSNIHRHSQSNASPPHGRGLF